MSDAPRLPRRTPFFTLLAVLQLLFGAALFALAVFLCVRFLASDPPRPFATVVLLAVSIPCAFGSAALHVMCGIGLWKLRQYGWTLSRIWAALILAALPIGTVIGILLLSYLNSPGVRLMYSERPADDLSPVEFRELTETTRSIVPIVTASVIFVLLGLFSAVGVAVSRVMPGLSRRLPVISEAHAMVTVERFAAAEAAYAAANGGRFGTPECLAAPARCIPGFTGSIAFTHPPELWFEDNGYIFQFFSPETVDVAKARRERADLHRLEAYALLALPTGGGFRMFCIDGTGKLRATSARRSRPSVLPGVCPSDWTVIKDLPR
ncbi:MAG TPA: hypothetical protein VH740_27300 [Vicinamibacterales bacterium]|jgi:hypothetical protein